MKNLQIKFEIGKDLSKKGTILIIAFLTLGILLLLGVYFISFTLTESRIAKSQTVGTQAYYIAEAGIHQAIWKLKNDDIWKECFATSTAKCDCKYWKASFSTSTDTLLPNSSVSVTIKNLECARGRIVATSTIVLLGGKMAQRVVETVVFKSLASPTEDAAVFSGGASENIDIKFSKIRVYGNLFSNHNLDIKGESIVEVYATSSAEGKILAVGNFTTSTDSTVSSIAICAKDTCQTTSTCACSSEEFERCEENRCPPLKLSMPLVDFDSAATSSFKSRAQQAEDNDDCSILCEKQGQSPYECSTECVFSEDVFNDLLWEVGEGGALILNITASPGIVYVEGRIEVRGGRHLVVNGALLADRTIDIGARYKWKGDEGKSQITINQPTTTTASGLLTKAKINFGSYSSLTTTTITGVVYANDEVRMVSLPEGFILTGGIIARKLSFTSVWQWFDFILNNEIIRYGLGYKIDTYSVNPTYSPIITIEHWEEAY